MNISLEDAERLIQLAKEKSVKAGTPFSFAVTDGGGHLKAFAHMEGAFLASIDIAIRKAKTSVMTLKDTAGELIGALGVSGGTVDQDLAVARAAVDAFESQKGKAA